MSRYSCYIPGEAFSIRRGFNTCRREVDMKFIIRTSQRAWPIMAAFSFIVLSALSAGSAVPREECLHPPAGTIFCEDFEGPNPKANFDDWDDNEDAENQLITENGPSGEASNRVIRLRVPAGRGGSDLVKVLPGSYDILYARWYFMYEPGFNFSAPNHGGGLSAGDRIYIGQSGIRPSGSNWAGFYFQYLDDSALPFAYSYYRGMYQDCVDPNGQCWGDSFPCVYDNGSGVYCEKPEDYPLVTLPVIVAGRWYCYEQMVDMGAASSDGSGATGRLTQWIDGATIGDNSNLWLRTTTNLKLQNLWLSLFHHDGTHSVVGELIDNVVISTQRIGCGTGCVNAPVWIRPTSYYGNSIQSAYSDIDQDSSFLLLEHTFQENLIFNKNIALTVSGGYDCAYSGNYGRYSTISGSLNIRTGQIKINGIIIK